MTIKSTFILFIVLLLVLLANSDQIVTQSILLDQLGDDGNLLPNSPLNSNEETQKGQSITDDMVYFFKKQTQLAYSFYRNDMNSTIKFIYSKLNATYPGVWFAAIINSEMDSVTAVPSVDFSLSTNSMSGSWWFYARNINHYWPTASYFFARLNSRTDLVSIYYTIDSRNPYTTFNNFKNIVDTVQMDTSNLLEQSESIKQNYESYRSTFKVNSIVAKKAAYVCIQSYDYSANYLSLDSLPQTTKNKYHVGAIRRGS